MCTTQCVEEIENRIYSNESHFIGRTGERERHSNDITNVNIIIVILKKEENSI